MLKKLFAIFCTISLLSACASQKDGADLYGNGNGGWNDDVNIADLQGTENTEKFRSETPAVVYFKLDSSDLTVEGRENLAAQAKWLAENPRVLVVLEGRCDERGTREYNLALGERRAMAARNYLMAQGVSADRIVTEGAGSRNPIASNATAAGREQNRRVEIVLLNKQ